MSVELFVKTLPENERKNALSSLQRLVRIGGAEQALSAFVEGKVLAGWSVKRPNKRGRVFSSPSGATFVEDRMMGSTGMDYAAFLATEKPAKRTKKA